MQCCFYINQTGPKHVISISRKCLCRLRNKHQCSVSSVCLIYFCNQCWKHFAVHDGCTASLIRFHFRIRLRFCLSLTLFLVSGWRDSNSKSFFKDPLVSADECRRLPLHKTSFHKRKLRVSYCLNICQTFSFEMLFTISPPCIVGRCMSFSRAQYQQTQPLSLPPKHLW